MEPSIKLNSNVDEFPMKSLALEDCIEVQTLSKRIKFSTTVRATSSIIHPAERISTHESIESARQRISDALIDAEKMLRVSQTKKTPSASQILTHTRFMNPWTRWINKEDRIHRWKHAGSGQM